MLERRAVQTEAELAVLHPVIENIWREVFTPIIGSEQVAYMLKHYQGKENIRREMAAGVCYYALFYAGECVGYTAYERTPEFLYLSKIYIAKDYRGIGLMRQIFDWYDQLSAEFSLKQHLRVNQGNAQAIAVYKRRGFELVAEDIVDIGEGFQMIDYLFEKNCC